MSDMAQMAVLASAQDRIDKTWINRLRKTWKGYVGRAKNTGYMQAVPFLQNGIDWLLALANDLAFNKGFFTFLRSKKEETEVYKIRVKAMEHIRQAAKELEAAQREIRWWDEVFTPGTRDWGNGAGHRFHAVWTEAAKEGIEVLSSAQADQVLLDNPQIGERILSKQTRAWLMEGVGKADSEFNRKFLAHITRVINKWKSNIEFGTAEREFNVGNVKVVMTDLQGPFPQEREDKRNPFLAVPAYLKQLQKAEALLRQKGLGFLWYGPMFVKQRSAGGKNPLGDKFGLGAHYEPGRDIVVIYNDPTAGLYRLIAHELGHRYYYKFMNSTQRAEFNAMFGDVPAVSEYGRTIAEEDFAEVFSYYIDNRNLTRDQLERLKRFLTSKGKRAAMKNRFGRYSLYNSDLDDMSDFKKAVLKVAAENPEFCRALKAELSPKTAGRAFIRHMEIIDEAVRKLNEQIRLMDGLLYYRLYGDGSRDIFKGKPLLDDRQKAQAKKFKDDLEKFKREAENLWKTKQRLSKEVSWLDANMHYT